MLSRRATAHPDRANTPAIRARAIRARAKLLAQRYSCPRISASPRECTRDDAPVCNSDIRYMHPRAFRCSSRLARSARVVGVDAENILHHPRASVSRALTEPRALDRAHAPRAFISRRISVRLSRARARERARKSRAGWLGDFSTTQRSRAGVGATRGMTRVWTPRCDEERV